jgi:hypothetical protein
LYEPLVAVGVVLMLFVASGLQVKARQFWAAHTSDTVEAASEPGFLAQRVDSRRSVGRRSAACHRCAAGQPY